MHPRVRRPCWRSVRTGGPAWQQGLSCFRQNGDATPKPGGRPRCSVVSAIIFCEISASLAIRSPAIRIMTIMASDYSSFPPARVRRHRCLAWFCLTLLALLALARSVPAQVPDLSSVVPPPAADPEPITPIPPAPAANPLKLALGEHLFEDRRLSHDGTLACVSCHDIHSNGADSGRYSTARDGSKLPFTILTVFNAASNFRLNWEGNYRTPRSPDAIFIGKSSEHGNQRARSPGKA